MMKVECGWCGVDLGWKRGPDGQVSHGICKSCQAREMEKMPRPFSVPKLVLACVGFAAYLLLAGWAGECDRQDALAYQQVHGEIVASASGWAVTR